MKPGRVEQEVIFAPSRNLSWIIGILAGGGYVSSSGMVYVNSSDKELHEYFSLNCETIFHLNVATHFQATGKDGRRYDRSYFHNHHVADLLGDLRRTKWPETLQKKHSWILNNKDYVWGFIGGFFEVRGWVDPKLEAGIKLSTSYPTVGYFLADLLTRVGIKKPGINYLKSKTEIRGVWIDKNDDIELFTDNVHSKIPRIEDLLRRYQQKIFSKNPWAHMTPQEIMEATSL